MATVDTQFRYLSVTEAAISLGLTGGRVRQMLLDGTLSGHKLGGAWAIPLAAVERLRNTPRPVGRPRQNAT